MLFMSILVGFIGTLYAEDKRTIPLDMYLIIDGSSHFQEAKTDAIAWLNGHTVDRVLTEGDNVTIWAAGESAEIVYQGEIADSAAKRDIKDKLQSLPVGGIFADFSGALRDLQPRLPGTSGGRISYTILVTASAGGLGNALSGSTQTMLRWSRSEKYEGWQALILAPDIGRKVGQAAQNYMNSQL